MRIFEWILEKTTNEKIDCIVVSGDMFDSDADAASLRPKIKRICDDLAATIIVIPGNHDIGAFRRGYDYGKSVIQCIERPHSIVEISDLKIAAIPYQDKKFVECISDLPADIDILVAHGTLYDPNLMMSILDDEEDTKYMPIYPANLENLARYAALGHLHARSIEKKYGKTVVVYPGAPIALTTKCVTERSCCVLTIDHQSVSVKQAPVDIAPYYQRETFFVFAGNEEHIISKIEQRLSSLEPAHHIPDITIRGYTDKQDRDFNSMLDTLRAKFSSRFSRLNITNEVESWDAILEHPVVRRFVEKTKDTSEVVRMKIFETALPIFSKLLK